MKELYNTATCSLIKLTEMLHMIFFFISPGITIITESSLINSVF